MCLLNLHEDERSKPSAWIPVGWLPVYNEQLDFRPTQGFHSSTDRKMRLYHQCWVEFLHNWAGKTKLAEVLTWADGVSRLSQIFFAGLLGDQQEADKYTAESCVCHRCKAPRKEYLTPNHYHPKSMIATRKKVEEAAQGSGITGHQCIVRWDADGRNVRPGPGATIIVIIVTVVINVIISIIAMIMYGILFSR